MVELNFYGGVSEIGGNKVLLKAKKGSIFLDFGLSYGQTGKFFEEYLQPRTYSKYYDLVRLGILPKIDGIYRKDMFCPNKFCDECTPTPELWQSNLKCYEEAVTDDTWRPNAVFISHAHADHCGYLPYLGNIPVYCSENSQKLMKAIAQIGNLNGYDAELIEFAYREIDKLGPGATFPDTYRIVKSEPPQPRTYNTLKSDNKTNIAEKLDITAFDVGHSIPGSMCSLIEADGKQILYTGDLRFHGRTQPDLSQLDNLKPDAMITEGTRIDDSVPDNETQVEQDLRDLIERTTGLVMVGFAWKDIERYETVKKAAKENGRIPVFDPRLAYMLARLGTNLYTEGASVFVERSTSLLYSPSDYTKDKHKLGLIDKDDWNGQTDTTHLDNGVKATDLKKDPDKYVLHLDYFRFKNLLDIDPPQGSVYVRAQCEPFNQEMELSEYRMMNWLKHFNINEANNHEPYQIHASGHASGKELQEFIAKVKPKKLIPIHTNKPKLFYNQAGTVELPDIDSSIQV